MKTYFDREHLDLYKEPISFCRWVGDLLTEVTVKAGAKAQLDRASTSIPLNIAEGNGKFSAKDRSRFLEMARGFSGHAGSLHEEEGIYASEHEHDHEHEHEEKG